MTEKINMPDFDGVLQEYYQNGFGVNIRYEQTTDRHFLVEIAGLKEAEVLHELQDLAGFQSRLQKMKVSGDLDRLVGHFRRLIRGTTKDN